MAISLFAPTAPGSSNSSTSSRMLLPLLLPPIRGEENTGGVQVVPLLVNALPAASEGG